MLQAGDTAPEFTLVGASAGEISTHSLSAYTDRGWTVVLTFYPFDFHPACTTQWCALREADWLTLLDDVVVLGVGGDSAYSHREYAERHNIQFTLLADTDGAVSEDYGVLAGNVGGHRAVPQRSVFVVDPDRTVQYAWSAEDAASQPDIEAVRKATGCRDGSCVTPGRDAVLGGDEGDSPDGAADP